MQMEPYKEIAARWFVSLATGNNYADAVITKEESNNVYNKFINAKVRTGVLSSPRDCYADDFMDRYNQADLMGMMFFLDGYFILHFIHLLVEGPHDLEMISLSQPTTYFKGPVIT